MIRSIPFARILAACLGTTLFLAACQQPTEATKTNSGQLVVGNTPTSPAPAGQVYVQGTLTGNRTGYQIAVVEANEKNTQYTGTLDAAGHFYAAVPQGIKGFVVAWKDLNGNSALDLGQMDAYTAVGQMVPGSNPVPLDFGTTNSAEIVVPIGAPATVSLTVNLPAAAITTGDLSVRLSRPPVTAAGIRVIAEFFGSAVGKDYGDADLSAGATSATFTLSGVAGVQYDVVGYYRSSGSFRAPDSAVSGTTSYNSSATLTLPSLATGSQTLTLKPLKYRTVSGTVTNVTTGKRLSLHKHEVYPDGSSTSGDFQTITSPVGTTETFSTLVIEGAKYTVGAYNDVAATGIAGDKFAWYQGTTLAEPAGFSLDGADKTDLTIALAPLTSVTIRGTIRTPTNVDGQHLQVDNSPRLDWGDYSGNGLVALSGGVAANGGYEYGFTKEVPASAELRSYLNFAVGIKEHNYLSSRNFTGYLSSAMYFKVDTTLSEVIVLK